MNNDKTAMLAEIASIRDENKLLEIFENSDDFEIRYSIVNLIDDNHILYEIFSNEEDTLIKSIASNRISTNVLNYDDFNKLDEYEKVTYIENHSNESLFHKVLEMDENFFVRVAAICKISDRDFLLKMAKSHNDYNTRIVLYKKLNNKPIIEEISGKNLTESRMKLVEDLNNEKILEDIAINDTNVEIELLALKKLNRPQFYFNLMKNTLTPDDLRKFIKALAINKDLSDSIDYYDFNKLDKFEKIAYIETHSNESLFFKIVENDEDSTVRTATIHKISDRDFLLKMAKSHNDYNTRIVLYKKLNNKPIIEEISGKNLTESRMKLVKDLNSKKFLKDIAFNDCDMEIKSLALKKLNKPHFYFSLIKDTSDHADLRQLIDNITDESQLIDTAFFFSSDQFIVECIINKIANPSVLFELYHIGPDLIRKTAIKKLVFGNVFYNEKIADKISIDRIILSISNEDTLADIAKNDDNDNLRRAAVEKINDKDVLTSIARNNSSNIVRKDAIKKIDDKDILTDIIKNGSEWSVQVAAVEKIDDKDILTDIAKNHYEHSVRIAAVEKIDDKDILTDIARNDSDSDVRRTAIQKIDDKDILIDAARNDPNRDVRRTAIKKIDDNDFLADIARNDSDSDVRIAAVEKINDKDILVDVLRKDSNSNTEASHRIGQKDILIDIARNDSNTNIRKIAVENIDDVDILIDIVRNDSDWGVRIKAIQNISDEDTLACIANSFDFPICLEAVKCISDEDVLIDIARSKPDEELRRAAVENIYDNDILADILRNDSDWSVREKALGNISDANVLKALLLENYGYFSVDSYSSFKRNYDNLIYESIGTGIYENILDKISDESILIDLLHEKLFSDFRILAVRRLVSKDALSNLALNDRDYRVRIEAIKNPNLCDEETFVKAIQKDNNDAVRLEALRRIDDRDMLDDIINDLNPLMRLYAFERLGMDSIANENDVAFKDIDLSSLSSIEDENVLYSIVKNAPSSPIRKYAFNKIKDEHVLADLVCSNREYMNMALNKITDKALLLNIALYCTDQSAKRKAIKKIDDEEFLLEAVQNNPYNEISEYMIDRIRDESLLEIIAYNNSNPYNRKAAVKRIQSEEIITGLGKIESEEIVCTAIVRKTQDKGLLEYIGLSNPCKTVRRYVGSITDDEEILYKFARKEYEFDNKRELISKLTNEEYVYNLLKRENDSRVYADFKITNQDMLIDLAKNAFSSYAARKYALNNIEDNSVLIDFIYGSPFISKTPKDKSVWEGIKYTINDKQLCLFILTKPDFDDIGLIEDFLIENEIYMCGELLNLRDKITESSSIYRILLNCKSRDVRRVLKPKLEYTTEYENDEDDDTEDLGLRGLGALFG